MAIKSTMCFCLQLRAALHVFASFLAYEVWIQPAQPYSTWSAAAIKMQNGCRDRARAGYDCDIAVADTAAADTGGLNHLIVRGLGVK